MTFAPSPEEIAAFKAHAIACYPQECVGVITAGGYQALENVATDPDGVIPDAQYRRHYFHGGPELLGLLAREEALAVLHSHPDGPEGPSAYDMRQQAAQGIPWGLCMTNGELASDPWFWGDTQDVPPLLGRQFRHGPSGTDGKGDCGALVRDWYRLERGILLPDQPRDDEWWNHGKNLYVDHYAVCGFGPAGLAPGEEPQIGDVALLQIRARVPNHAAIYVGGGLIMHHLPGRLSVTTPSGPWLKQIVGWMRHAV